VTATVTTLSLNSILLPRQVIDHAQRLLSDQLHIDLVELPCGRAEVTLTFCDMLEADEGVLLFKRAVTKVLAQEFEPRPPVADVQAGIDLTMKAKGSRLTVAVKSTPQAWTQLLRAISTISDPTVDCYLETIDPVDRYVVVLKSTKTFPLQTMFLFLQTVLGAA
jgi:hypothetical protein